MKNSRLVRGLATVGVCALALVALGSANNPVERPFKILGHTEATVTGVSGFLVFYDFTDEGEATHYGRFFTQGSFVLDLSNGQITGIGLTTVANGDTLVPVSASGPGINQFTVTYSVGSGRFANVSGGFIATFSDLVQDTTTVSFNYTGEGVITY